jgi:hypothetical protein
MNKDQIDEILSNIQHGKRCYCGFEDGEYSTVISIDQNGNDLYSYTAVIGPKYDVIAPAQYDKRLVNEPELRILLANVPDETFSMISYRDTNLINDNNRERADLIYSYLKQKPKALYAVFKEDRWEMAEPGKQPRHFNGLYRAAEEAQRMVDYLRIKQGLRPYWKQILLSIKGDQVEFHGGLSDVDQINVKQTLGMLLDMDTHRLLNFFRD